MLEIKIPGREKLYLEHLVSDFNGTLGVDGKLLPGVMERLNKISQKLDIHIITADTHSSVKSQFSNNNIKIHIIGTNDQDTEKLNYIKKLGCEKVVCFGNGANDELMLKEAALGICVLLEEGIYAKSLIVSDILVKDIKDGLDLLIKPLRIVATLRT